MAQKAPAWFNIITGSPNWTAFRCLCVLLCLLLTPFASIAAALNSTTAAGIAWQVKGTWQISGRGKPLVTGDPIRPGLLLQPGHQPANNSIVVLLPDGQSHLFECFTVEECARGFRVPALQQEPKPSTDEMMARIRAVLLRGDRNLNAVANLNLPAGSPRDEVVAALGPDDRIHVEGLAAKLPNGHYYCDVEPLDPSHPAQHHVVVEKTAAVLTLQLPSPGLYVITVQDDTEVPRIHLFLAAVSPVREPAIKQSLNDAKILLRQWNEDYYGWPFHDLQWAYLESLALHGSSDAEAGVASDVAMGAAANADAHRTSSMPPAATMITAEPMFSPPAGVLNGTSEIVLQSGTPGATIHYTVDSSQPNLASPIYTAPIVIQGSGLTIKAFATRPGKKDSAIVTAVFRIRKQVPIEQGHAN